MTDFAAIQWLMGHLPYGDGFNPEGRKKVKRKLKVSFIDLVRPETVNKHCIYLGVQEAFGVVQWMLKTGDPYHEYQHSGVADLLAGSPTVLGIEKQRRFSEEWKEELETTFHYAVLSDFAGPLASKWRQKFNVNVNGSAVIDYPHYDVWRGYENFMSNASIEQLFNGFFRLKGRKFRGHPNRCHPSAQWVQYATFIVRADHWETVVTYGYKRDSSSWHQSLRSTPGELLVDFILRAAEYWEQTLLPVKIINGKHYFRNRGDLGTENPETEFGVLVPAKSYHKIAQWAHTMFAQKTHQKYGKFMSALRQKCNNAGIPMIHLSTVIDFWNELDITRVWNGPGKEIFCRVDPPVRGAFDPRYSLSRRNDVIGPPPFAEEAKKRLLGLPEQQEQSGTEKAA